MAVNCCFSPEDNVALVGETLILTFHAAAPTIHQRQ